jgi:hypothetical protein
LENHPELKESFAGFRYYPNTLGVTPSTYLSVPALLSGKTYDNSQPVQEYMDEVLGAQSLPGVLDSNGFRVDMLTLPRYCNFLSGISCRPIQSLFLSESEESEYEAIKLLDFTIFRFVPHTLKKRVHNNYEWWLQPKFYPERIGEDGLWRSIEFPGLLRQKGTLDAPVPTAKFFHLLIPHPPYSRDADCEHYTTLQDGKTLRWGNPTMEGTFMQSRCAVKVVDQIFTVLVEIGVFHNSDIVIFSDHGTGVPARGGGQPSLFYRMETAFPVLMVKPAGATEGFQVDQSALSLTDIPRIVGGLLDLNTEFPGLDPGRDRILADRPRRFLNYAWQTYLEREPYIPGLQHFRVSGDALDSASWTRLPDLVPPSTPSP